MKRLATILVIAYGLMLCVVGAAGIVSSPWELTRIFDLDLASLPTQTRATFLNQYRFLKGLELGGGLFCLLLLRPILTRQTEGRVFLGLVGAGVVARSLAWIVDGRPTWPFILFLGLEALVLVVTGFYHTTLRAESTTP